MSAPVPESIGPPPRASKHELRTLNLLHRCYVLDVVALQAARFRKVYGVAPITAWLHWRLKARVIQECIALGMHPGIAVIEPIELGEAFPQFSYMPPIVFGDLDPGLYVIIAGDTGKEIAL